jgi:PAS domain-containing protein
MIFAAALAAIIACNAPAMHDGDTLRCNSERVRLFGVDAPEVRRGKTPAEPLTYEARDELIGLTARPRLLPLCRPRPLWPLYRPLLVGRQPRHQHRPDPLGPGHRVSAL